MSVRKCGYIVAAGAHFTGDSGERFSNTVSESDGAVSSVTGARLMMDRAGQIANNAPVWIEPDRILDSERVQTMCWVAYRNSWYQCRPNDFGALSDAHFRLIGSLFVRTRRAFLAFTVLRHARTTYVFLYRKNCLRFEPLWSRIWGSFMFVYWLTL